MLVAEVIKLFKEKSELILQKFIKKISSFDNNAHPDLVNHIKLIDCYGEKTIVNHVANVVVIDNLTLSIKPWVKENIKNIEKGIASVSSLEVDTKVQGSELYVVFPPMSQERRDDFAKNIKAIGEDYKVSVRKIRTDIVNKIKEEEKAKILNKDDAKKMTNEVTKLTQDYVAKISDEVVKKSKALGAS